MKMCTIVDRCFIKDYNDSTLTLSIEEEMTTYKLDRDIPILHELTETSCSYKIHFRASHDDKVTLMKIEEIEEIEDIPAPDENETLEIRNDMLKKVDSVIEQSSQKLENLKRIKEELERHKNIEIEDIQKIYNKLNDWI